MEGTNQQIDDHMINSEFGDNLNQLGGAGDNGRLLDVDQEQQPTRKRKYHRHTEEQTNELESFFKECTRHPDEVQINALSEKLGLKFKQIKFWFQNRRSHEKTQLERHKNILSKQDNDRLRLENHLMRTSLSDSICYGCSDFVVPTPLFFEQLLRSENSRLKEELNRVCSLANKVLGRPLIFSTMASTSAAVAAPRLDHTIGLSNMMRGLDLGTLPSITTSYNQSMYMDFALLAMQELMTMANIDEPLWVKTSDDLGNMREVLNLEEYGRIAMPTLTKKPDGLVSEATRVSNFVVINGLTLVELLMNVNHWMDVFTGLVANGTTLDVVCNGVDGTKNGTLQIMLAEFQMISPMVNVRHTKFLRFCKKHATGVWAVLDLPLETNHDGSSSSSGPASMRLPSGCVIQDLDNGCCKVTWVENSLYNANLVNQVMQPMISSGIGFGAKRWMSTLQRHCECTATLLASAILPHDHTMITMAGKKSLLRLSQRMVNLFSSGVSVGSSSSKWEKLSPANVSQDVRFTVRKNSIERGETLGVALSASTSMWLPVSQIRLFEFLANSSMRNAWDVSANGRTIEELVCLRKTHFQGNSVAILRASQCGGIHNHGASLILQDTWNDESSSVLVYASVETQPMELVMNGGISTYLPLLPSGFAIFPDGNSGEGCIMTVGFQTLMSTDPTEKVKRSSIQALNNLLCSTIQRIKYAFHIDLA